LEKNTWCCGEAAPGTVLLLPESTDRGVARSAAIPPTSSSTSIVANYDKGNREIAFARKFLGIHRRPCNQDKFRRHNKLSASS
jgi:hypothetical protein